MDIAKRVVRGFGLSCALTFLTLLTTAFATPDHSADPTLPRQESPELEAFGALIVGAWEAGDSRQVHEWGVGRRLIRSRAFFLMDGEWVLVSEGIWFWDSDEGVIRGTHLAIEMPVERFEYRSVVEGSEVRHDLTAHGQMEQALTEVWLFDGDSYTWRADALTEDGPVRVASGRFSRAPSGPDR